ncbi:SusE domain-containing protein [Mucilaginibacter boryungensis]|uniref:SusE domain-containing protein n=1 Tax=Mucilaginibacter boryungensis TaxID=768480 RepID=A0ABR9XJ76_9SPHI|nr:SusE domain-containing protein [Mucilaginibacter boryungensis]MBE9667280.1 SusE domain-containing protein [Mucilaginibacter boryungensis]
MKTLITKFLALSCLAVTVLAACKKDETRVVANSNPTASTLTLSTTAPTLNKATLTANAITITATPQSYGYNAAVNYTLQLAVKGTNFAKPVEIGLTASALSKSWTVQDFNNLLLSMNLPFTSASQVEVRLKSFLSPTSTTGIVYSNVGTITATPFPLVAYVYVPGAYQGWNPATADSLQSATGNGVYTGIINYTGTDFHFKITPAKKWDVAYGDAGGGKISTSGGDILAPGAGLYQVTVDLNANTITMVKAAAYYSVIGDATAGGWGNDTDMKFNNGTQIWEITIPLVSTGQFKVRKNHDWTISYGIPKTGANGSTLASSDDDNIPVAANGTYKFTFAPIGTDNAKATYTLVKQ